MIDIERIKKKAKEIKENILLITKYTSISEQKFSEDMRNIFTLRYLLLELIEGCAAICNHILTKFGKIAPAGYTECFKGLEEIGVFDSEFTTKLVNMARFRNLLVHHYSKVDDHKVFEYSKKNLSDFEHFLNGIARFLKTEFL